MITSVVRVFVGVFFFIVLDVQLKPKHRSRFTSFGGRQVFSLSNRSNVPIDTRAILHPDPNILTARRVPPESSAYV